MTLNPAPWLRGVIYVLILVGTPVVGYLNAKGYIGELELTLWGSLVTVGSTVAALNLSNARQVADDRERGKHERRILI